MAQKRSAAEAGLPGRDGEELPNELTQDEIA